VESEGLPGTAAPNVFGLAFPGEAANRRVSAVVARAGAGPIQSLEWRPIGRAGVSYGTALSTDTAAGGATSEAPFALATVESAGTVLLEVWRWWGGAAADRPGASGGGRLRPTPGPGCAAGPSRRDSA
jgi:hypothetical protein